MGGGEHREGTLLPFVLDSEFNLLPLGRTCDGPHFSLWVWLLGKGVESRDMLAENMGIDELT